MAEEYTQNYLHAFESVLESFINNTIDFEIIDERCFPSLNKDISIIMGFVGDQKGQVSFSMRKDVAITLTSILAGGMEITEIDELVKSAIGELANMVMGNACTFFSEQGVIMDITPPSIITGDDFYISNLLPLICHDIIIEGIGKVCFDIAIKD